jgi:4-hydroxy-2-oxoheptanedioate aldolase
VDVVYLGIYDLALSMGLDGNTKDPKVSAVMADAIARVVKLGKIVGCMIHNQEEADYYKKLGVKFLAYKVDTAVLADVYGEMARRLKDKSV